MKTDERCRNSAKFSLILFGIFNLNAVEIPMSALEPVSAGPSRECFYSLRPNFSIQHCRGSTQCVLQTRNTVKAGSSSTQFLWSFETWNTSSEFLCLQFRERPENPTCSSKISMFVSLAICAPFLSPCQLGDPYQRDNIIMFAQRTSDDFYHYLEVTPALFTHLIVAFSLRRLTRFREVAASYKDCNVSLVSLDL